jgi:Fic family protein
MPGEFRPSKNWIGGNNINPAVFIPPHHDFVNELIGDLENFLHSQHPVPEIILPLH